MLSDRLRERSEQHAPSTGRHEDSTTPATRRRDGNVLVYTATAYGRPCTSAVRTREYTLDRIVANGNHVCLLFALRQVCQGKGNKRETTRNECMRGFRFNITTCTCHNRRAAALVQTVTKTSSKVAMFAVSLLYDLLSFFSPCLGSGGRRLWLCRSSSRSRRDCTCPAPCSSRYRTAPGPGSRCLRGPCRSLPSTPGSR